MRDVSETPALPGSVPPANRPKTREWLNKLIVTVVVVMFVCCGAAAWVGYRVYRDLRYPAEKPRAAVEAYLIALQRADTTAALDSLCKADRRSLTSSDFAKEIGPSAPTAFSIEDVKMVTESGQTSAVATVVLTYVTGLQERKLLVLRPEGGSWKICDGSYQ